MQLCVNSGQKACDKSMMKLSCEFAHGVYVYACILWYICKK